MALLDRRLLFVTGKGGVGKTTVAAALALEAARQGKRTLICEADSSGNLSASLETGTLGFEPRKVRDGLVAMAMDTEESLKEYLKLQLRIPLLARIGPLAHTFDFLANAAPGVRELLTVGKVCWEVKERHYDLVVVDAAATGHIIGQLDAPRSINGLVQVGLVRNQTRWMLDLLDDEATTGVVVVTTPEEMPVVESVELVERLGRETNVSLAAMVVNRALPELFTRDDAALFDALSMGAAADTLRAAVGSGAESLITAAHLSQVRRRSQADHLERLREGLERLGADVPILFVPELFARLAGMRATATIADRLAEEL